MAMAQHPQRKPRWFYCDGCLGYQTRHLPEPGGFRCEGCHKVRAEKVTQDPEQEKLHDALDPFLGEGT